MIYGRDLEAALLEARRGLGARRRRRRHPAGRVEAARAVEPRRAGERRGAGENIWVRREGVERGVAAITEPKYGHSVGVGDAFLDGPGDGVDEVRRHAPAPLARRRRDEAPPEAAAAAEIDLEHRGSQVRNCLHGGGEPERVAGPGRGPDDDDERQRARARRGIARGGVVGCDPSGGQRDVRRQQQPVARPDLEPLLRGELVLLEAGELLFFFSHGLLEEGKVREKREQEKEGEKRGREKRARKRKKKTFFRKTIHRDLLRHCPVPLVPPVQEIIGWWLRVRDKPQDHARVVAGLRGHRELVGAVEGPVHQSRVGVPGLGGGLPLAAQALGGEGDELARDGVEGGGDDVLVFLFYLFLKKEKGAEL